MTGNADILFETQGALGLITLNRTKALNALTLDMIHAMTARLAEWAEDADITAVLVRGAGDKAFCAGGDVLALIRPDNAAFIEGFFRDEYRLNRMIFRYPKPYIALIDGIVMGGGVGVSVHGRYRVATERTLFAMPETGIGMFPDVGGTYFLPRLPGVLGLYLGLTGARLKAADCLHAGLADSYVPMDRHGDLLAGLADGRWPETLLAELGGDSGPAPIAEHAQGIDRCFSADSVEEIMARLGTEGDEWAAKAFAALQRMSPSALKIAFRQIREGRELDFEDCMMLEYRLSQRVIPGHDFREGVRALLVDKDMSPKWAPPTLAAVTDEQIDGVFAPLPGGDLTFPD
ncbi:MAG: enoyl-CoA hydratase/isomerase family protein [Alphaproteobacteria bacterium]|nr:enoyl-CoA hydratase/isomerase family protein [Alphaproteobacteria bacterium]